MASTRRFSGRPLLLAGFGSLLLLMLLAGFYALRTLDQVRVSGLQERDVYVKRDHALDQVRSGIYQSAIIMRDYLLESDPTRSTESITRWNQVRADTDRALAQCAQ